MQSDVRDREREGFKSIASLCSPRSVAIVGASERANWPKRIWDSLHAAGYQGAIYPVNPKLKEIWGVPCYPDLASIPKAVDHAAVIVPAAQVQNVLEQGIIHGLKSATVYAGNIGEGHNPEHNSRAVALRSLVRRSGISLNGPNCMGGNHFHHRFFGYPNTGLVNVPAGGVALVSQSGGTLQFIVQSAAARGVKFSCAYSSGNELDIDLADFINHFVDDPQTTTLVLFIEGIRRPAVFMQAAARALKAGKPIIAIKTGKSVQSQLAALSHTGAVAGDYAGFKAMCERYGIIACASLDDLVETTLAFQCGRLPKGARVGWVTTSGGTVDLLYDHIEEIGTITSPQLSEATKAKIRHLIPADMEIKNPLDAGIPSNDSNAAEMCSAVADDENVDILAWAAVLPHGKRTPDINILKTITQSTHKPVLAFSRMNYMVRPDALNFQDEMGIPYLQGLPATIRALGALGFYGVRVGRTIAPLPPATGALADIEPAQLHQTLAHYHLSPPRSKMVRSIDDVGTAADDIGYPVAVKIVSPQFSHKTEVGGVKINIRSADEARHAAHNMSHAITHLDPQAIIEGFLVQEMVSGIELIIGARTDPLYGPLLIVGAGGIFVELLKDVAVRLLPLTEVDAHAMLDELKIRPLLEGFRGSPPVDRDYLVKTICGLSAFYLNYRHLIDDIEINPLIVGPQGQTPRAVDVRIIKKDH